MSEFYTDGKEIYEVIGFDIFPQLWRRRVMMARRMSADWPSEWRGYPVRVSDGACQILVAPDSVYTFWRKQVLLVSQTTSPTDRPLFKTHSTETLGEYFQHVPTTTDDTGKVRFVQKVSREQIKEAMACSGFDKIKHCCPAELQKHCGGDEYKGNLEGFVGALMEVLAKAQK